MRVGQEGDRSRGWRIHAQWAMRGSFLPCGSPFHRFLLPSHEKDPSPPCQSTFLSHHSPTAVSGWRCVIIWTHLQTPACEALGFLRVVVVACSHLVSNMLHVSYVMVWPLTNVG